MQYNIALQVRCPKCGNSLMDNKVKIDNKPSIKLEFKEDNFRGYLHLSSVFGSYNTWSTKEITEGQVVYTYCPHCSHSFKTIDNCTHCGTYMSLLELITEGNVIFCAKKGCHDHSMAFQDVDKALSEFFFDEDHYD